MPVIVVGADTPLGESILTALSSRDGEIRAFVTGPGAAARLKANGIRVATGDVSDASHVAAAAFGCFSAVLVTGAAFDARERSFARSGDEVLAAWAEAIADAGVHRAIWVGTAPPAAAPTPEAVVIAVEGRSPTGIAAEVAEIDDRPAAS